MNTPSVIISGQKKGRKKEKKKNADPPSRVEFPGIFRSHEAERQTAATADDTCVRWQRISRVFVPEETHLELAVRACMGGCVWGEEGTAAVSPPPPALRRARTS